MKAWWEGFEEFLHFKTGYRYKNSLDDFFTKVPTGGGPDGEPEFE